MAPQKTSVTPLPGLKHLNNLQKSNRNLIIGIDPGLNGAVAIIDGDSGELVEVYDMPTFNTPSKSRKQGFLSHLDVHALSSFLDPWAPYVKFAVLEEPGAMPNQGLGSTFRFGHVCGAIHGVLAGHYMTVIPVKPGAWKLAMGLGAAKTAAREATDKIYPQHKNLWKRVKDADRSEAILLCQYGARFLTK